MRKIFTLAAAILASISLWAVEPNFESYDWQSKEAAEAVAGNHDGIVISYAGLNDPGNVSGHWYIPNNQNLKNSDSPWKYFGIAANAQIDSVAFLYCPNGSNKTTIAWVAWGKDVTPNQYTLAHGETAGTTGSKSWESAIWETIDLSEIEAYTVYMSRNIREFREIGGSSNIPNFGGGQTINILGVRVWLNNGVAPVTYTATYKANNGTAEADSVNTAAKKVAENMFTVPEGKKFTGWNTAADGTGTAYAPGAKVESDLTLYAQWATVCYEEVYNFNAGLGSAYVKAADATILGHDTLRLSNTNGRIVIKPAEGGFKAGDIIEMAGSIGNTAKKWGIKIDGGQTFVNEAGVPCVLTGVLNADADSLSFGRADGTTTNITSLVIKREAATCKEIDSKVETLIGAAINKVALDASDLNELISSKSVTLLDEYVTAPTVTFTKKVVTTYDDQSTKTDTVDVDVVAEALGESQWKANITLGDNTYSITMKKATSFTVTYLYDTDTLGTEVVAAGGHPAEYVKYEKKALSLFGGWYSNAALTEAVQMSEEVINSNKTYYAKFTVAYAKSMNFEQIVLDEGVKFDIATAMADAGYDLKNSKGGLDSLNDEKTERNEPYLGLKLKKTGDYIRFNLKNGDSLAVKIGHIEDSIMVISEGDTAYISKDMHEFRMTADNGDDFVQIITTTDKTLVFKQIMINKDFDTVILPAQTKFEASVSKDIEHGTITLGKDKKSSVIVNEGDTVIINVTPDEGYKVGAVTAGNAIVLPVAGVYAFVMPGQNTEVSAEFVLADDSTYIVTISESITNGYVVPDKYQAKAGDTITMTITPAEGYELEDISLEGIDLAIIVNGNTATFVMPKQNVTVLATFKAKAQTLYTVTLADKYEHGTVAFIEPNEGNKYAENAEVRLSVTPDEGYELEAISLDGIDLAIPVVDGVVSFNMPAKDVTVLATFKAKEEGFENIDASTKAVKFFENGQLYIIKNGVKYNTQGAVVNQ